jgi:hypothetical protein
MKVESLNNLRGKVVHCQTPAGKHIATATKHATAATDKLAIIKDLLEALAANNCAGNKQKPYTIMRMKMFAAKEKAKPRIENIRGLNLEMVKLTAIQVTKLPL